MRVVQRVRGERAVVGRVAAGVRPAALPVAERVEEARVERDIAVGLAEVGQAEGGAVAGQDDAQVRSPNVMAASAMPAAVPASTWAAVWWRSAILDQVELGLLRQAERILDAFRVRPRGFRTFLGAAELRRRPAVVVAKGSRSCR